MIAPVPTRATLGVGWGRGKPGETSARMVESHRAKKNLYLSYLTQFSF